MFFDGKIGSGVSINTILELSGQVGIFKGMLVFISPSTTWPFTDRKSRVVNNKYRTMVSPWLGMPFMLIHICSYLLIKKVTCHGVLERDFK